MRTPRKVQPLAVPLEPATPVFPMRITARKVSRAGGVYAYEGDVINANPQERATLLFWSRAIDV